MRAIIVDDEPLMIRKFLRLTDGISDLCVVGQFEEAEDALEYAKTNPLEIAFLDVEMPVMSGIDLAQELKKLQENILIVFITAFDEYIRESNEIGGDYYIVKPYTEEVLQLMMEKLRLIARRQEKEIYVQMFGRFLVRKNGKPVRLTGKAKEILALVATRRGKEISNEEVYSTLWEDRPYSNACMSVYYNALRRLRNALARAGIEGLLVSTTRGQTVNTDLFDCDYYAWEDKKMDRRDLFKGEFLSEYSWGESILASMLREDWIDL